MFAHSIRSVLRTSVVSSRPLVSRAVYNNVRPQPLQLSLIKRNYSAHHEETFEEFTTRYEKEFDEAYDLFEVQVSEDENFGPGPLPITRDPGHYLISPILTDFFQRVLNNCFSYDLVPAPAVIEKALRACRRVNDYATAVRVFEGLKHKVENSQQYEAYLEELKDVREELGIDLREELFPDV